MIPIEHLKGKYPRVAARIGPHIDTLRKAITFALIGVVNVMIDAGVFLIAYSYLTATPAALRLLDAFARVCRSSGLGAVPALDANVLSWLCSLDTVTLVTANIPSWLVAVSCSYVMNSQITFAAESGRRLRWKNYGTFVASGILGLIANTAALVIAAKLLPELGGETFRVMVAKGCAIVAGFGVNFSMSYFVVFRRRPAEAGSGLRP